MNRRSLLKGLLFSAMIPIAIAVGVTKIEKKSEWPARKDVQEFLYAMYDAKPEEAPFYKLLEDKR